MLNSFKAWIQRFADGGSAGGSAPGGDGSDGGNGLSGDFNSDLQKYFGITSSHDAGDGGADDGERDQEATDAGSVTAGAADAEAASSGQQEDDDGYSEFREKYKDRIHAEFQKSFNERFKKSKETETNLKTENQAYRNLVAPLLDKYGLTEDATPEQIAEKIRADKTTFSRQAMAQGVSTESYRDSFYSRQEQKVQEAQRQEQERQAAQERQAQQRRQAMQQTYERWQSESAELQKQFPQFDLARELKGNEAFRKALEAGLPVSQAYYGANFERISSGLVAAASQTAAKRAAQTVAANRARPSEGGQNAGAGIRTGAVDVASLTGQQIRDLMDRAARGERISF